MKADRPSTTARMVAFWRALADDGLSAVPGFSDPFARSFLEGGWGWALQLVLRVAHRMTPAARERLAAGFGVMPIRVAFIDLEIAAAVEAGVTQVVILGAGLDTRA